jgi:enoyl-CoA hydratase/carnithine racemase
MLDNLSQVLFDVDGPRATLTFNRPDQLNALSPTLISEALAVSKHVALQSNIRVLVVRANGRAFSAGVDLKSASSPDRTKEDASRFSAEARELALTWETMPQPVIARVTGYCFTGGLEIALGCDFIVCSDEAQFCDTHAKLGFVPSWGLAARLARRINLQRAREMSMTARRVSAAEAQAMGLVLEAVPLDQLDSRVDALAESICQVSAGSVAAYKDLYRRAQNSFLDQGVAHEAAKMYVVKDRAERLAVTTSSLGASRRS